MRLLIIADTHVPKRARTLPEPVWREVEVADVVVHAGDWVEAGLLNELEARCRRLIGVYGNNDGPELRARLPEVARAELDGLRLAVVHETGPAKGREQRCALAFPGTDVLVFGHSHIPWDTVSFHNARSSNASTGRDLSTHGRLVAPGDPQPRSRGLRPGRVLHSPEHEHGLCVTPTVAGNGLRLLNPGSPTDRRRQPECTYLTARVRGGRLDEVELHPVRPR